jgi:hypothetical protein
MAKTKYGIEEWQRLVLEQYDVSYRKAPQEANKRHKCKTTIIERDRVLLPDQTKKLFYHAGRFAGGARDRQACEAYRELQRMGEL